MFSQAKLRQILRYTRTQTNLLTFEKKNASIHQSFTLFYPSNFLRFEIPGAEVI